MHTFEDLARRFADWFKQDHFPSTPATLYDPNRYFLQLGGKRVRPVLCLMGNELFSELKEDAWHAATAIELFHNFTLVHDDIMDAAPLRRGMPTVHEKYGTNTALLAGDVLLVAAYEYLNRIRTKHLSNLFTLFSKTAKEVCEGQQLDMDFEKVDDVQFADYIHMINLKTSVLLGASLKMGAILADATEHDQQLLYEFGRKLGLAFQVQDDYLDAFGDPQKFGKQVGGDIRSNKKTFLLIHVLEKATEAQKRELVKSLQVDDDTKVQRVLDIFHQCKVDEWDKSLKGNYLQQSLRHLQEI